MVVRTLIKKIGGVEVCGLTVSPPLRYELWFSGFLCPPI